MACGGIVGHKHPPAEGAFEGMWDGTVDVNWAREHHRLWLEKEMAEGHISAPPPKGKMQPAE